MSMEPAARLKYDRALHWQMPACACGIEHLVTSFFLLSHAQGALTVTAAHQPSMCCAGMLPATHWHPAGLRRRQRVQQKARLRQASCSCTAVQCCVG